MGWGSVEELYLRVLSLNLSDADVYMQCCASQCLVK